MISSIPRNILYTSWTCLQSLGFTISNLKFQESKERGGDQETRESWNLQRIDGRMAVVITEEKQSGNSLPGQREFVIENRNSALGSVDHASGDAEPANNPPLPFRCSFAVPRPERGSIVAELSTERFLIIFFVEAKLIMFSKFRENTAVYLVS